MFEGEAHGGENLGAGDRDAAGHARRIDGEGHFAWALGEQGVAKAVALAVILQAMAGAQRAAVIIPAIRLDRPDLGIGRQFGHHQGAAAQQAAAAGADGQRIELLAGILEQFEGQGALAGDDIGMVEGRHMGGAALCGQAGGEGMAVGVVAVEEGDLGAPAAGCGDFYRGGIGWHGDQGRHAQGCGGAGGGLAVIAGGMGDHAARAQGRVNTHQRIGGAAQLEAAGALQGLRLDEDGGAHGGVQRRVAQHRGAVDMRGDAGGGGQDIGEAGGHAANLRGLTMGMAAAMASGTAWPRICAARKTPAPGAV